MRVPSVSMISPSTMTQLLAIHSSASRREQMPRSAMTLDKRGKSVLMAVDLYAALAAAPYWGLAKLS